MAWLVADGGRSWITTYIGLGFSGDLLTEGDCVTQYMLSLYWVLSTLVTYDLLSGMFPTTWLEVRPLPHTAPCRRAIARSTVDDPAASEIVQGLRRHPRCPCNPLHFLRCVQVAYSCFMMLITLTIFAYVLGELSNVIMEADDELVEQRTQVTAAGGLNGARIPSLLGLTCDDGRS